MIKGIAFDLEGPVVDLEPVHHAGHFAAALEFGVALDLPRALSLIPHFIGGPEEAIAEEIAGLAPNGADPERIFERMRFHYHRLLPVSAVEPREGFLKALETFRSLGLRTVIGSVTERAEAEPILRRSGLDRVFPPSDVVLKEDVFNPKPAPDVFLETARRMGIRPDEQLVFEDSKRGLLAAVAAGSPVIGMPVYRRPETVEPLRANGAIEVYFSWKDIAVSDLLETLNQV